MDAFIDTITRTPIFAGLSREDLARVAGKLDEVTATAGTTIIRQAEPGDALYVVQAGAVEVLHRDPAGDVERIAILGPRECFGEIALFYQIAYFGTGEQGFSHAQGRRFMVAKLAVSLLAIVVSVPWWRALGLVR